jgi:short-subunit dehydrogenase
MAGHEVTLGAPKRLPPRQAGAEDRRLSEMRPFLDPDEGVLADDLGHLLEQVGPDLLDEIAHLGCLAALTGEENRCAHRLQRTPRAARGYTKAAEFPPFGGLSVVQFDAKPMSLPKPTSSSAALVTGASAGIGGEIAHELARRGHNVILVARRQERLDELAGELAGEHGIRAETIACDLADPEGRARLHDKATQLGLDVDVLVNNAGFATSGPFPESDPDRELQQVRVLVEAVVALTRAFVADMVARERGAILNVASTAGMQPIPYNAGYSAAKAYVLTFSEALHQELRGRGVTVTALAPGPVETEFWDIAGWEVKGGVSLDRAVGPARISPRQAARAGVNGLASGERVVVPGLPMRTAMIAARWLPHAVKLPALEWMMRRGAER